MQFSPPASRGRAATWSRFAVLVIAVLAALAFLAGPASAHVRVSSTDATQGGYGLLTFRVPTESDTASTTELRVTFPDKTPIVSVSTQPMPGWSAKVVTKKLDQPIKTDDGQIDTYVSEVVWTADSPKDGIGPGEFQLFNVSAGPLPEVGSLSFPAMQYYSDGSTVNWNETATGSAEPEHPAPTLELAAASSEESAATADTPSASMDMSDSDSAPAWPGIVGLVAGVLGLVVAGVALARTRNGTAPSS